MSYQNQPSGPYISQPVQTMTASYGSQVQQAYSSSGSSSVSAIPVGYSATFSGSGGANASSSSKTSSWSSSGESWARPTTKTSSKKSSTGNASSTGSNPGGFCCGRGCCAKGQREIALRRSGFVSR